MDDWEVRTLSSFSTGKPIEAKNSPAIRSRFECLHLCVPFDDSVISFDDSCLRQEVIKCDSSVDCLALSHDATFLFTCLNDGSILMTFLPQNRCVLKQNLVEIRAEKDCAVFQNIFFLHNSDGTSEILILTSHTMFHYKNIQLEKIKSAVETSNTGEMEIILGEITNHEMSYVSNGGCVFSNFDCFLLLSWDKEDVNLLSLDGYEIIQSTNKVAFKGANIMQASISSNGRDVFLLDKSKVLNRMCLRTFLVTDTFSDLKIDNFALIESLENSGFTTIDTKLLFLIGFKTSCCSLGLYHFPDFKLIYSIGVCPYTHLIDMPQNQDCILFLEGCKCDDNEDIVTALNIQKITEASCEAQLNRLLHKRLFEDALQFASDFNLSSEVVIKAKANYLLEHLSRRGGFRETCSNKCSPENIAALKADLFGCLDKIVDIYYVINFCVSSTLPSLSDTLDMLLYAKRKLCTSAIVDNKLWLQVFQTLKKLQTFKLIFGESQFSLAWDGFMRANLWDELLRYLLHKKLDVASLLWEQHIDDFLQVIDKSDVVQFLESIPEALFSNTLSQWLKSSVLPPILSGVQESLECVAAWVIQCLSTLELTDRAGWPINAINFAQMFLDVCQDISSNPTFCGIRIDIDVALQVGKSMLLADEAVLPKLHKLLDNLQDLKELRDLYNCKLSLADYSQKNKQAVVFRLLDWVNGPDEIPHFVNNFLKPYSVRNSLTADELILHYIMNVMEYTEFNWWLCEEPPWEAQIISLIHCLEEEEIYLNAICKMLQTIPVPWSQRVHDMVNKSIKSKNPLVENIKFEIGNITQKTMLVKYGFQRINLSDVKVAETVMKHIILKSIDSETVMQDVLVIAKHAKLNITDAYIFRLKHLIQFEKISDCLLLLKRLPSDVAVPCCRRLALSALEFNLFNDGNVPSSLSNYLFMKVSIFALYYLKSLVSSVEFEDYVDLLQKLESSYSFQENFGVYLNIQSLNCEHDCVHIFESNVESFLSRQELNIQRAFQPSMDAERKQCADNPVFQHLFLIASFLNIKRVIAMEIIAKKAFALQKYDVCIDVCGELCYPNLMSVDGNILLGLICYLVNEWCKKAIPSSFIEPLISMLGNLLASATVFCKPDFLESCAYLGTWISLLKTVRYRSHVDTLDFSNVITLSGADPYNEWTYSTIFKETALMVELEKMLPHLNTCLQNVVNEGFPGCNLSKNTIASVTDLIRQLKLTGQLLLAHSVYVESITMFFNSVSEKSEYMDILLKAAGGMQNLTLAIVGNVVSQVEFDYPLSLGLLLSLPKDDAIIALETVEQRSGFDYRKLRHIAIVGEEFSRKWLEVQRVKCYRMLHKESEWGCKFSKLHLNFKDAFRGNAFDKMNLMQQIANQPQITLLAIRRYCFAFDLDLDEALLITLNVLLTSIYENQPHSVEKRQQGLRSQSQALNICSQVMRQINNKKSVSEKLNATYVKTDPYNYEILEFILESTLNLRLFESGVEVENAEKGLILLRFLKTYKRISEPSEFEIELWLENSEFSIQNKNIKERLPYHSLLVPTEAVKILVSELNAFTIDLWLNITDCLKLHRNEMIMLTVENLVRQIVPKLAPSLTVQQAWVVMVPNKQLLYAICDLIARIDDLEKATACATSVVKRLPPSFCKVYATMGAISFARKWWEATQSKKAERAMNLLQNLHSSLYSDQILYEHGLNEARYLALHEQPEELICHLYEHPSIEQRYWLDSNRFPDIHGACEKIAAVTQCDMDELRLSMLNKWIFPTEYLGGALDETVIEDFCAPTFDFEMEDDPLQKDRNFKRSIYILQRGCMEDNATSLVRVILNSSTVSYSHKLRALKCLLHVADVDTIQRLTQMDIRDLRVLAKTFLCRSQLEQLRLTCELPHIENPAAARDLAIQLLQSQSRDPITLTLAADLCFNSNFHNIQMWNTIFQRMIDAKVYKPLRAVLFSMSSNSLILQSPVFFKAWCTVLKDDTMDKNEPARGFNKLFLLHRCPLLHELDLLSLAEYFDQVSLPVITIDCFLHLVDHTSRRKNIEEFMTAPMIPLIVQHLKELRDVASSLYHLDEITKVVLLFVAKKTLSHMNSSVQQFLENCINDEKDLDNLVMYAVQNDMSSECAALLQKHMYFSPNSEFAKTVKTKELVGLDIVKIYSEAKKLDSAICF